MDDIGREAHHSILFIWSGHPVDVHSLHGTPINPIEREVDERFGFWFGFILYFILVINQSNWKYVSKGIKLIIILN